MPVLLPEQKIGQIISPLGLRILDQAAVPKQRILLVRDLPLQRVLARPVQVRLLPESLERRWIRSVQTHTPAAARERAWPHSLPRNRTCKPRSRKGNGRPVVATARPSPAHPALQNQSLERVSATGRLTAAYSDTNRAMDPTIETAVASVVVQSIPFSLILSS